MLLKFKALSEHFALPKKAFPSDAGLDMKACEEMTLEPGDIKAVSLGCSIEIPEGFEIQVRPRSGLALKSGITVHNSPGTIDASYRGECKVILFNAGKAPFKVDVGDRICQFVVMALPSVEVALSKSLTRTDREEGGFGSTGK